MSPKSTAQAVLTYDARSNRFRAQGLEPTEPEHARILARHPALTKSGYYPHEKYQRENDWRAAEGMPLRSNRPPESLADVDEVRRIGLVRAWLREIQTETPQPFGRRLYFSWELQPPASRWAGERMSNGAIIAGAVLEGCEVSRYGTTASALIMLCTTFQTRVDLLSHRLGVLERMNVALALVPNAGG